MSGNKNSTFKLSHTSDYPTRCYIGGLFGWIPGGTYRTIRTEITLTNNTNFRFEISAPEHSDVNIGGIVGYMEGGAACPIDATSSGNSMTGSITAPEDNVNIGRLIGKRYRYSSSSLLWNGTDLKAATVGTVLDNSGWTIKDFTGATWDIGGASSTTTTG